MGQNKKPVSTTIKNRIVKAYLKETQTVSELSRLYNVKANTIWSWISRYRKTSKALTLLKEKEEGEVMSKRKKRATSEETTALRDQIKELQDQLKEMKLKNVLLNH